MVLPSAGKSVSVSPSARVRGASAGVMARPVAVKRTGWPARVAGSPAGGVTSSAQAASRRRAGRARRMVLYILVILLFLDIGT